MIVVPINEFSSEYISVFINPYLGETFVINNSIIVFKMNVAAGGSNKIKIINGLTAHIFRHNYCANLCYQMPNISIKRIAQLLGDSEKMVLEVYNHVLEQKENVQEVVKNAINF